MMILAVVGTLVSVADKSSASVHAFFENMKQSDATSAAKQIAEKQLKKAEERQARIEVRNTQKLAPFTALCDVPCYKAGVVADTLKTAEGFRMDFADSTQHATGIWLYAAYHNNDLAKAGYIEPNGKCMKSGWEDIPQSGEYYNREFKTDVEFRGLNILAGSTVTVFNPAGKRVEVHTKETEESLLGKPFVVEPHDDPAKLYFGDKAEWVIFAGVGCRIRIVKIDDLNYEIL